MLLFSTLYDILTVALPKQRSALVTEGSFFCPLILGKGGLPMMVTYSDLIQLGILIVGVINLFFQVKKK